MQSDERVSAILDLLAPQRDAFRSAVAEASEQLRSILSGYRSSTDTDAERAALELGRFARGRIDPAVFAVVFGDDKALEPAAVEWIDRAEAVLQEINSTIHLLQYTKLPQGGDLRAAVQRSLARIGRAFGAVRVAEYARAGRPIGEEAQFLNAFPFAYWNRSERRVGLPLIVELAGEDLHVGGLEEVLDGTQAIILIVNGEAPPAALVRLITPNVLVMQTTSAPEMAAVAAATGPAIAALVPETCMQFVSRNRTVELRSNGNEPPIRALGTISAFQQREETLQLRALAQPAPSTLEPPVPSTPTAPAPEDVLAGWLLRQADVA